MSRAPTLTTKTVTSLKALLDSLSPADYLGTDKEVGVAYLVAMVRHAESPTTKARRQRASAITAAWREQK